MNEGSIDLIIIIVSLKVIFIWLINRLHLHYFLLLSNAIKKLKFNMKIKINFIFGYKVFD